MSAAISSVGPSAVAPHLAWNAVLHRDARYDGRFVYAVTTTGVYCRPSCASRRPRRDHVEFFAEAAAAESAGYRACLKCGPLGASRDTVVAVRARAILDEAADKAPTLIELSRRLETTSARITRSFRRAFGMTPRQYAARRRAERLKSALRAGHPVLEAAFESGFGAASRAYAAAEQSLGMTPSTYRRGGEGVRIRYAVARSGDDQVLVAFTDRGVCAVSIGGAVESLRASLRDEFPRATIEPAGPSAHRIVDEVVRRLRGERSRMNVPVDLQGTAFELSVWRELTRIPRGATRSYGEVARRLGKPSAARAVASACARNRVALLVPCHRVVRSGGASGGYRWGADRKRKLLERERT
jgi:AraC family transcriptional regulator, regulatory protein of adaptative response / methylated-DNA-[protein]-cysteine methyltransferase